MKGFTRHPASRLRRADAPGLAPLLAGIAAGGALHAGPGEDSIRAEPGPPWLFCQSGGSGGAPKVIRRSPASWQASFAENARRFAITPADCIAALGHPGHSLPLYAMLEALHLGADLAALGGLGPRAQARALAACPSCILYATPTQIRLLLAAGTSFVPRLILIGGGHLPAPLRADLARACPAAQIHEFYGTSETSFISLTDEQTPAASVGRAYPGVEIRAGDGPDAPGDIRVRSPYLFAGYGAEGGWSGDFWATGERGYLDAAGYLFLTGRVDRQVNIADQIVQPEALERCLARVAAGRAVAAVPMPDAARGVRLVAVIEGPHDAALAERLRAASRDLPAPLRPGAIRFWPALPLLVSGKPDLRRLRAALGGAP